MLFYQGILSFIRFNIKVKQDSRIKLRFCGAEIVWSVMTVVLWSSRDLYNDSSCSHGGNEAELTDKNDRKQIITGEIVDLRNAGLNYEVMSLVNYIY